MIVVNTETIPGMRIYVPADPGELEQAVALAVKEDGPCYIRCSRDAVPLLKEDEDESFSPLQVVRDRGDDYAIVYEGTAGMAAVTGDDILTHEGVQIVDPDPHFSELRDNESVEAVDEAPRVGQQLQQRGGEHIPRRAHAKVKIKRFHILPPYLEGRCAPQVSLFSLVNAVSLSMMFSVIVSVT